MASLKIPLKSGYFLAFAILTFVLHEAHEWAHIDTGRLICGGWGERDFNVWSLAEGCAAILPTAVGPLFTFALMWVGAWMILRADRQWRYLGLALVFANLPVARLLTAALGGGDEMVVLRHFAESMPGRYLLNLLIVSALAIPPVIVAYRALALHRRKSWFAGLFLVPLVVDIVVVLLIMNTLLSMGVLAEPVIGGSPLLILVYFGVLLVGLGLTYKNLLVNESPSE